MSAKSDHIDLNSDAVLSDPENEFNGEEAVENDHLNDPDAAKPEDGGVGKESLEEEANEFAGRGNDAEVEVVSVEIVVDEKDGDVSLKMVGDELEKGKEGRNGDTDGLEVPLVVRDETVTKGEGLVLESQGGPGDVDDSLKCEKATGEDKNLREGMECEPVSAVDGDHLASTEAKPNIENHGEDNLVRNDKKEFALEVNKASFVIERYQYMEQSQHAEIWEKGALSVGNQSFNLEGRGESQSPGALTSMNGNGESKTLLSNESVGRSSDDVPATEVKVDVNEPSHQGVPEGKTYSPEMVPSDGVHTKALDMALTNENQTSGIDVSETQVAESTGKGSTLFNIVIDLNPYTDSNATGDINVGSAARKSEFHVSDLVWGKIRSHPWWPGQIFDPSDSSVKAKKYFKKDTHLIAYFGDCTFAWNEASSIKPFLEHFSQMEKQSNTEDFHDAITCALDEVSRRVEFGLACPCLSEEVYAKLKTQIIVNSGICKESSRRDGGDSSLSVASFKPVRLVEYIKELAQLPCGSGNRLEFVVAKAQLLSFYRWKGYFELPDFNMLGGLLENDADILQLGEKRCKEVSEGEVPASKDHGLVPSRKAECKSQDISSLKRKRIFEDSSYPSKKEKSLSELMAEKRLHTPIKEKESEVKASKVVSESSYKKRKAGDSMPDDLPVKNRKCLSTVVDPQLKQNFRVGESIRRVASQLNGSSSVLKYGDEMPKRSSIQTKSKEKIVSEKSQTGKPVEVEYPPEEMLLQLSLAARNPLKKHKLLVSMVKLFSEFRNSICLDLNGSEEHEQSMGHLLVCIKDSYWSDRIIKSIPEEQTSLENQNEQEEYLLGASEKASPSIESQAALEMDCGNQSAGDNLELEAEKSVDHLSESCKEDNSSTALILNFSDINSVPSESNLNEIFSRYGPLNESETEVLKKSRRAKVVFKRRSDAETAFSSAGKYSIFGPSLVSYRLKYSPSTPSKASLNSTKQDRKDPTSPESNAT
ncbi:hypothetical protein FNV43_RR16008 [Rhamnella rubrinervis]|uniref:PWWP domain-containing protein n=1 Tax=Rhamnella rubrinervis TaxID=2594499 RepID=A0A8K0GUT2_9ROSA|nr:hypothetical protein FNV43_RR16008 [Rhamnella rubrinervis]